MKDVFAFLKLIIIAALAGGFLLIGYVFYAAYDEDRIFVAPPPPTAHDLELAAFDAKLWAIIRLALWLLFLAALTLAIVRFLYVPSKRNSMIYPDERGNWPLLKMPTYKDHNGAIHHTWHNENLSAAPGTTYAYNGAVNYTGHQDMATADQYRFASMGWAHQVAQAVASTGKITAGAVNAIAGRSPESLERDRLRAERERVNLQIAQNRLNRTLPVTEPVKALPVRSVDAMDAFKSMTDTEFPLGYSEDGQVVAWDVESSPHIRVHGKTQGSGKTNVIKTIAVAALCAGHRVIVLDRRGFKDWKVFEDCAELVDNRQTGTMAAVARQIEAIYQVRDAKLGVAGVGNLAAMGGNERRIFLVVSEFGTACRSQDEPHLLAAVNSLKNIFSEAGASGVHLIFEDQVVNRSWPRELRGNADPITGYLPEDTAKGGGYSKAYELERYQFHYEGERFRTWDMNVYAARLLVRVPPLHERLIDLDSVRSFVRSFGKKEILPDSSQKITFTERTNAERTATELQALVWQWRDVNPDSSQAQMRKAFEEKQIIISRGYAHQCWHSWPGGDT